MDQRILKIVELIQSNLQQELTLEAMARAVNLSPSRLHHLFKREIGVSPAKYLKALRLQQVKELLEGSFLSIKEIRIRVGMRDESHFIRDFKRAYGLTPSLYRARHFARLDAEGCTAAAAEGAEGAHDPEATPPHDAAVQTAASAEDGDIVPTLILPAFG